MSQPNDADDLSTTLRAGRIVTLALAAGIGLFLAVTAFLPRAPGPVAADPWSLRGPLAIAALVVGWGALLLHPLLQDVLIAGRMANLVRATGPVAAVPDRGLAGLYLNRLIVGSALLDGAAVFNAIAYCMEGSKLNLGLAILLALAVLSRIPVRERAVAWIEQRRIRLEELQEAFPEELPF